MLFRIRPEWVREVKHAGVARQYNNRRRKRCLSRADSNLRLQWSSFYTYPIDLISFIQYMQAFPPLSTLFFICRTPFLWLPKRKAEPILH